MDDYPKTDWCSSAHMRAEVETLRDKLIEVAGLSELFKVLGDETRTRILYLLAQGELCTCHLADVLGMTLPAISHHLRLLRMTRLVKHRREGKYIYYTLDDAHVLTIIRAAQAHFREER